MNIININAKNLEKKAENRTKISNQRMFYFHNYGTVGGIKRQKGGQE